MPVIVPASYVFNLSIDLWYNDIEFKRLFIDLGASTQSTKGIGQLKKLQQLNISIKLNKNRARSTNFIFRIGSAASIRSVNLGTLLRQITFHIMLVNILFLLCLADMNKLGAFFNNITNEIIQSQI